MKTSLAPGSQVVTAYLDEAGLTPYLDQLRFQTVAYGCTTCIGNSGPLPAPISQAIEGKDLVVASVLSGNRNFEGRVHPEVRANYLMSPPLVVAFALAGRVDIDFDQRAARHRTRTASRSSCATSGRPAPEVSAAVVGQAIKPEMYSHTYARVFEGDRQWQSLRCRTGPPTPGIPPRPTSSTRPTSRACPASRGKVDDIKGARALALLGDSITTDHISPAGSIKKDSPAGKYLISLGVDAKDFNSYGARRGNHEVMVRGTFANTRLRNLLAPGTEGGVTRHLPDGQVMSIYDAATEVRRRSGVPLVVLAGKEYGSGSSRDWAAKGTRLLGVKAVIAESYERIHRSNLIGMGVVPLEFLAGRGIAAKHGLTGEEVLRHHRPAGAAGRRPAGTPPADPIRFRAARRHAGASSRPRCASTPPRRPTYYSTAASCRSCCARC